MSPIENKLIILYRLESGCLGPNGASHIERFCPEAQSKLSDLFGPIIRWELEPRHDITLPELDYRLTNKRITRNQASTYLSAIGQDIDEVEAQLFKRISLLANDFLGH